MNSFTLHIIPAPTSDLHYPVSTKQQFSRDSSALELHSAIALIKPSESTSGLLICYFLRPALQRKSHLPVKWCFCLKNEKFCFKRDTLDNQGPVMGLATCLPSCCEQISSLLALCCSQLPPTHLPPEGAHLRPASYTEQPHSYGGSSLPQGTAHSRRQVLRLLLPNYSKH